MRQMLCPRVIGRDQELRTIETALAATLNGQGGSIFLLGEAGVGKSRLAREAERLAREVGLRVLWGRAVAGGTAVPYRAITEALLSALRRDGLPEDRPELRPFLPILGRLIPDWRAASSAGVDDSLVLLSEAVVRLLRAMALNRGCLLVLEDLHWADSETLAVLEYLTANVTAEPLVLLATSRSETTSAALDLARTFERQRSAAVFDLGRLDATAVREMASACLGTAEVPAAVDRLLDTSADGLPLLVEDLLAEWVGAGALIRVEGEDGWHVGHVVGPIVPISFAETVRRRQRLLGQDGARLLRQAALLGRHFDWTLLPSASGLTDDQVLALLRAAVEAQLLSAEPGGFRFRHALTQAAVLADMLPVERAREAARLLVLLETTHPRLEGEWCELAAALAEMAGDRLKAAQLLFASGRASHVRGALATAEATLEQARALAARQADAELRALIDEVLQQVLSEAGKHDRVFEVGDALLATMASSGAPPVRSAAVHLCIAQAAVAGARLAEATQHLELARRLDPDGALEARIDGLAAHVAIDELRVDDAERLAHAALAAADRLGEPAVACEALLVIGRLARLYDLDRAEQQFERAYKLADAPELTVWRSRALHELGTIDMLRDLVPGRLLEAREQAVQSGALATVALVDGQLAAIHELRFELDLSRQASQRALDAGRRFRLPGVVTTGLLFQAEIHVFLQDRPGLERKLAELPRNTADDAYFGLCAFGFRAEAALVEEDRPRALRDLATAMDFARAVPVAAPSPAFGWWALLSTLGGRDGAQARESVRTSWAMVQPVNRGMVACADAADLGSRGLKAEAAQAMAEGDRMLARAPWFFHYVRRLVAEAAIRDGWGVPAAWLRESLAFFEQHGYDAVASACRSLLRKCGAAGVPGRGHRGVPEPFGSRGVTEREIEVLAVLCDGLSNKEIGARLYLSPKTVEKHVASLMDKLEVRTRAHLAAIATANMGDRARSNWGESRM